jgi:hypothetical protein
MTTKKKPFQFLHSKDELSVNEQQLQKETMTKKIE